MTRRDFGTIELSKRGRGCLFCDETPAALTISTPIFETFAALMKFMRAICVDGRILKLHVSNETPAALK